ncbi:sucrase ferredoxin [Kribbella sp. NPDC004536]|uniref:sucrase ferredoxin n=1 Tax=Kribbella sp. NPDC004536 TaxID=3364106 RepID=UPI003691C8CD
MDVRYRPETGCAAQAELRRDSLTATAPPAERWLLIESHTPWPRQALTSLPHLGDEVARRCRALAIRPVLIRRYGRVDRTRPRRFGLIDSRPGREAVRWGELPSDDHLLTVLDNVGEPAATDGLGTTSSELAAADRLGSPSSEPVYLVCTHGRHDACCAVRGRPVAAALAAAYPERTWECSHIGGDRFAANVVVLPHSLFYGQVSPAQALDVARRYDDGDVVPELLRGSGAFVPPVQAAQEFARAAGHSLALGNLLPQDVHALSDQRWRILLASTNGTLTVEVSAHLDTVDARLTCAGSSPAQLRRFELDSLSPPRDP